MDKKAFIEFLENKKKSKRTINSYPDFVQQYESYLFEHKKIRARLYHEAGLDTIDKMAACDSDEIRKILVEFI